MLFAKIVVIWMMVSQVVLAIAFSFLPVPDIAFASRDIVAIGAILVLYMTFGIPKLSGRILLSFFPLLVILLAHVSVSNIGPVPIMATMRQMLAPGLVLLLGTALASRPWYMPRFIFFLTYCLFAVAVLGIVERVTHFWGGSGLLVAFFEAKNIAAYPSGYPYIFIEPVNFFEFASHTGVLRATSTLLDPINFGHTMVAALTCHAYARSVLKLPINTFIWKFCIPLVFTISIFLSVSKGAIIQYGIIVILFNYLAPVKYINVIGGLFILIATIAYVLGNPGFLMHFEGLSSAFDTATLFGHGLATAGNYASMLGTLSVDVNDTFLGSVVGQIGVAGYFAWLLPFLVLVGRSLHRNGMLFLALFWSQVGVSIISENAFNFGSIFVTILLFSVSVVRPNGGARRAAARVLATSTSSTGEGLA